MDGKQIKHIFKLDPDKRISDQDLEAVCESGSDAIIVGGTLGITYDKTIDLLSRIRRYALPCFLEISNRQAIVPGFDHYLIPFVMNATEPEWIIQPHFSAIKEWGAIIPWSDVSMVGYCILNQEAEAARLTKCKTNLEPDDLIAYGRMAQHMFQFPYFYFEYSGRYGDERAIQQVAQMLKREGQMHLLYGGGIRTTEQAEKMKAIVDTIVVGNIVYDDIEAALATV